MELVPFHTTPGEYPGFRRVRFSFPFSAPYTRSPIRTEQVPFYADLVPLVNQIDRLPSGPADERIFAAVEYVTNKNIDQCSVAADSSPIRNHAPESYFMVKS